MVLVLFRVRFLSQAGMERMWRGEQSMSPDFKRGFLIGMGVLVAAYVFGLATGVLKKVT